MKPDSQEFRKALGAFPTGVTVITTVDAEGNPVAMTASSFNSVSLEPPLVLFSIGNERSSLSAFLQARCFAIHVLGADQQDVSSRFARSGAGDFTGLRYTLSKDNVPLFEDFVARYECETRHEYEGGDHLIIVGEVRDFSAHDKPALLLHRGRYASIQDSPPS